MPLIASASKSADQKPKRPNTAKFLELAQKRFKLCCDAEKEIRREAREDLEFRAGQQWDQKIKSDREAANRPCETFNRIPQFVRQVTNEARQNRPSIQINPVGEGADKDTAEIIQGLTRHIENYSQADIAYDTAFDHAVTIGFGYFSIGTEYEHENSFNQEAVFDRIENPFSVYIDPSARRVDYSDMEFGFRTQEFEPDAFKDKFPDAEAISASEYTSEGDTGRNWYPGGKIRVAEYWWIDSQEKTICQMPDGTVLDEPDVPRDQNNVYIVEPARFRTSSKRVVNRALINGKEVLEENIWPGRYIPIVPVLGDEIIVNGERRLVGIVRFAKGAQRQYNYMRSAQIEMIALAPKAPWVGTAGQFEGYEQKWQQVNVINYPYLEYNDVSLAGHSVPPPNRVVSEPPIQAMTIAIREADNDMKATTGIYDASLGEKGPEQSGKAILARQKQGDTANFGYIDNLSRSIRHAGRILLDLIPKIYDTERIVRIINPDQTHDLVTINAPTLYKNAQKLFDVTTGRYDVTITVGPTYQSRRQEAAASMLQLVQSFPQVMQVAGDLMIRMMDWPGAQEIADRLKKLLPPNINPDQEQQPGQIPPALLAQNAQLQQKIQQLTQMILQKVPEMESRERIAALNAISKILAAEIMSKSVEAQQLAQQDHDAVKATLDHRLELLHIGQDMEATQADQAHATRQQDFAEEQAAQEPQQPPATQ